MFLLHVVLPPLALFGLGVGFLMYVEGWEMLTSCYVIMQILTTVGYGDFTVTSSSSKLFIALYSLCVLAILSYYVNLIMARMVAWESDCLRAHLRKMEVGAAGGSEKEAAATYGATNELLAQLFMFVFVIISGMVFFRILEHCSCSYGIGAVDGCVDKDFQTCAETGGFVKTWIDVFYMSVITLSTVGFGDYQPRTWWGRFFGIFWMLFGVSTTAVAVSQMSTWMFESGKKDAFAAADAVDGISRQVFDKIDTDKSGTLSQGEFLTYTLLKYKLVDEELMEQINALYDSLDTKGTNAVPYGRIVEMKAG